MFCFNADRLADNVRLFSHATHQHAVVLLCCAAVVGDEWMCVCVCVCVRVVCVLHDARCGCCVFVFVFVQLSDTNRTLVDLLAELCELCQSEQRVLCCVADVICTIEDKNDFGACARCLVLLMRGVCVADDGAMCVRVCSMGTCIRCAQQWLHLTSSCEH